MQTEPRIRGQGDRDGTQSLCYTEMSWMAQTTLPEQATHSPNRKVSSHCVLPILTSGSETWRLTNDMEGKLTRMTAMLGVPWRNRKRASCARQTWCISMQNFFQLVQSYKLFNSHKLPFTTYSGLYTYFINHFEPFIHIRFHCNLPIDIWGLFTEHTLENSLKSYWSL